MKVVINILLENGYNPKRKIDEQIKYKILLEAYPSKFFKFDFKYRIKYRYSALSAKPEPVYRPEGNIEYDAILCYGPYEADIFKIYAETYIIGNMKYVDYAKKEHDGKPNLLYLPTYGDISSIDCILGIMEELKTKYKVIVKMHHGTSFLKDEQERVDLLKKVADEWHDVNTPLDELLSIADVVLSDNSGAVFEAIYVNVPVAIYAKEINKKLGDFDTTQYLMVQEGIIPYTYTASKINEILELAISEEYRKKQRETRAKLFSAKENLTEDFISVIKKYLNDEVNQRYKRAS